MPARTLTRHELTEKLGALEARIAALEAVKVEKAPRATPPLKPKTHVEPE